MLASLRLSKNPDQNTMIQRITYHVCQWFGVNVTDLKSTSRTAKICDARFVLIELLIKVGNLNQNQAAKYLNRNHATIISARKKLANLMETEPTLASDYETIKAIIYDTH
jgi:chromosomal replication initiation ATPase DnaA